LAEVTIIITRETVTVSYSAVSDRSMRAVYKGPAYFLLCTDFGNFNDKNCIVSLIVVQKFQSRHSADISAAVSTSNIPSLTSQSMVLSWVTRKTNRPTDTH